MNNNLKDTKYLNRRYRNYEAQLSAIKLNKIKMFIRDEISCFITVCLIVLILLVQSIDCAKMVRLCIASVDPIKLSSQCVMCSRREFPLTAIDCTGITKMNDLIANPLSVQEATCLIYNCRRQVPSIKPEPYHGSVSHAIRTNYQTAASQTRAQGIMPFHGMFGGGYPNFNSMLPRYSAYGSSHPSGSMMSQTTSGSELAMRGASPSGFMQGAAGLLGGSRHPTQQALPYAVVPAPYSSPFGSRKYKAALVPLFK